MEGSRSMIPLERRTQSWAEFAANGKSIWIGLHLQVLYHDFPWSTRFRGGLSPQTWFRSFLCKILFLSRFQSVVFPSAMGWIFAEGTVLAASISTSTFRDMDSSKSASAWAMGEASPVDFSSSSQATCTDVAVVSSAAGVTGACETHMAVSMSASVAAGCRVSPACEMGEVVSSLFDSPSWPAASTDVAVVSSAAGVICLYRRNPFGGLHIDVCSG